MLVGVLLTLVVLSLSAAFSARSEGRSRRLAQLAYLDQVRPLVERSSGQGADVAQVRAEAVRLGRDGISRRLGRVTRQARDVLRGVEAIRPPASLTTAHSVLVATMAVRARAATVLEDALAGALRAGAPDPSIDAMVEAAEDVLAADRTYRVFLESLPRHPGLRAPLMPESAWATDTEQWARPELAAFVATLRSTATLAPVHDVRVLLVATEPSAVGTEGGASVLPLMRSLRLQIVVANTGNEAERAVPVVASLNGPGGELDTARDFVDLAPGQRRALTLGGLRPVPGGPSRLDVVVGPVNGEGALEDNRRTMLLVVRG